MMLLALALQAAAAAPPDLPFEAAVSAWARCAGAHMEALAATPRRDRHVVSAALAACRREEAAVRGHFVARFGKRRGRRAMAEARALTRARLERWVPGR